MRTDKQIAIIRSFSADIVSIMNNRRQDNEFLNEAATEIIYNFVVKQRNKTILKELKKDILAIFELDDFFQCTQNTLMYWTNIINVTATYGKEDLLTRYLSQ